MSTITANVQNNGTTGTTGTATKSQARQARKTGKKARKLAGKSAKPVVVNAQKMPAGLSVMEECLWIASHSAGAKNSTKIPATADAKGIGGQIGLKEHAQGWTASSIAAELKTKNGVEATLSGKLANVKNSIGKTSGNLDGATAATLLTKLASAGLVYNG